MSYLLNKACVKAPPIIGNGCTQRYDPEQMTSELGADFSDACALWRQYAVALDAPYGGNQATDDSTHSASVDV